MEKKGDCFDRLMHMQGFNIFEPFYKKNKEIFLYIFFGGLTTVVSIVVFFIANDVLGINVLIANIISWIFAVTFAYVTNRVWVFGSKAKGKYIIKEAFSFYVGRLTSLAAEEVILIIFVSWLGLNSFVIKIVAQFVVLIMNYFISKLIVFEKKGNI